MSRMQTVGRLEIPESLASQLSALRKRVWATKLTEAAAAAVGGVGIAYLAVFAMDRIGATPAWARGIATIAAVAACGLIPYCLHRWVWNKRRFHHLARMLSRRLPQVGDQLLGVIEISESDSEQARSRELCQAAIEQVAQDVSKRNLNDAVPFSYFRTRLGVAAMTLAIVGGLFAAFPEAASNAWSRFLAPWQQIARYTFAAVMPLDNRIVVPHGEEFTLDVSLAPESKWKPEVASAEIVGQKPLSAKLAEGKYTFTAPGQINNREVQVGVGDWSQELTVVPKFRPELKSVGLTVELPAYLQQSKKLEADARSGKASFVEGSKATIHAVANRSLASASIDGVAISPKAKQFSKDGIEIVASSKHELIWKDKDGLAGAKPFTISIEPKPDAPPVVGAEGLTPNQVVLDSEQLKFAVKASDDFGVRQIGMEWKGVSKSGENVASGEKLISTGGPEELAVATEGLFTAASLGIEPQTLELRLYVDDYLPGRKRSYSPAYVLQVLDQDEHAAWLMDEMAKFQKAALEVRDREVALHNMNLELRALPMERIQSDDIQSKIAAQASAEASNGRRLSAVAGNGVRLVQMASKNPAMDANGVATMADMVVTLQDMADNRMPSIASLLKQNSGGGAQGAPGSPNQTLAAGIKRSGAVQGRKKELVPGQAMPPGMTLADSETSHQPAEAPPDAKAQKVKAGASALDLASTTLKGRPLKGDLPDAQAGEMDQAIDEQRQLLDDFAKLAGEMSDILSKMEGATFVKRLKAASRDQTKIAGDLSTEAVSAFGMEAAEQPAVESAMVDAGKVAEATEPVSTEVAATKATPEGGKLNLLSGRVLDNSKRISTIMDDMYAYAERSGSEPMQRVLEEMRGDDVLGDMRNLASDLPAEPSTSVGQLEYWADTTDRWAEDLLPVAGGCKCPGGGWKRSLPPEIVLEVLKILDAEMALREETRAAQKTKLAIEKDDYVKEAHRLADSQDALFERTDAVLQKLKNYEFAASFGEQIGKIENASKVMKEAAGIIGRPNTGGEAVAAESEAIEILLAVKRAGEPKAGAGSDPGSGSTGDTSNPALAMIGQGIDAKARPEAPANEQSTGKAGRQLPDEYRQGLDKFFEAVESGTAL